MDISLQELAEKLSASDEYRIVYHIRPDGDCIGSAFALALGLQSIGKKCEVVGQDPIPRIHQYMTDQIAMDSLENPVWIAVDSAAERRTGCYQDQHFTFCIDHHHNTFTDVDYRYVEQDCGACSEIIFKLLKIMQIPITKQIADLLYTAIVTDTLCFRTTDTSAQTFRIAAELTELGADIYTIGRRNTFIKSAGRLKIESTLRDSFHFTCDRQILTGIILLHDLETAGILDSDLGNINSFVEEIEGVRVGVTIRELTNGRIRCSVHTNGNISADAICREHGGGGHFHAAGCELSTDAQTARSIMEETSRKYLLAEII
ncbi:MAG: DHH family phosphoesterase [Oscillospiraceae bacterium]|nr:DHH family phosphoesterase [Oscillospiraceae bacterium]